MIAIGNFRYLQTRALSFLTITRKMESQKHATRFDIRYDTYSGLWCHKPMKELGFECDFVKLRAALAGRRAGRDAGPPGCPEAAARRRHRAADRWPDHGTAGPRGGWLRRPAPTFPRAGG